MEVLASERILTEVDHLRLSNLVHRGGRAPAHATAPSDIAGLLDAAMLVPSRDVCPDIATMYSQVLLADPATRRHRKLTLCYPWDAEPAAGFVSVLSPVGASLLGLRVGATARWAKPLGDIGEAELLAVLFQPEASGDYTI